MHVEPTRSQLPERFKLTPRTFVCPRMPAPVIDGKIGAKEWSRAGRITGCFFQDGNPAHSRTTVWIGHDDAYFYAAVRCDTRNTAALQKHTGGNNYAMPAQVMLYLDTAHDHVGLRRFDFGPCDQVEIWQGTFNVGYRDGPDARWLHCKYESALRNYCRSATHVAGRRYWGVEAAIPFESLGVPPPGRGTVWGFNVERSTRWPACPKEHRGAARIPGHRQDERVFLSTWPGHPPGHPAVFADVVFDDTDALQLAELDLAAPHFGENRSLIRLTAPRRRMPLVLSARVKSRRGGMIIDPGRTVPLRSSKRGGLEAQLLWKPFHSDDTNVLEIEVKHARNGRTEWRGSYDFGWESGSLPLHYLHDGETQATPPNPDPADPEFLRKKAEFIAGRQPRFRRITTAQGAPSDFTLESSDGRTQFNLMEPGVTEKMARFIHGLYATDADRLMGMMFFMAQPCMMRHHTAYDPDAAHRLNPMSKLRFGSGYCGHMARIMSPLVNRMPIGRTGRLHRAWTAMIGGHALTMVAYRGDYIFLDSKHCCMFYRPDNRDLATLAEIRRTPEIVRRAYPHWIMRALLTFDERYTVAAPPDTFEDGGYVYPAGAPSA